MLPPRAFPYARKKGSEQDDFDPGMSLRAWFMGRAITGLVASDKHKSSSREAVVAEAKALADLLVAAAAAAL